MPTQSSDQPAVSASAIGIDVIAPKAQSRTWRRFRRHKLAIVGAVFIVILSLLAIFAPIVSIRDPYQIDLRARGKPPSAQHVLGTDLAGRDVWSRVVYGGRVSLSVGLLSVVISGAIGILLGGVAGYYRGTVDQVIMRITDVIMTMPTLVILLALLAFIDPRTFQGAWVIVLLAAVIGLLGWPGIARLVRGQFLSLREQDFVQAARAIGCRDSAIIFRHIIPNVVGPIVVWASFGVAGAILTEAALSFLGFGVQTPTASWGNMLTAATELQVIEVMLWLWIPPGLAVTLAVLSINFVGDALRDALDPRSALR